MVVVVSMHHTQAYNPLLYDGDAALRREALQSKPWTFQNMLPFEVFVYVEYISQVEHRPVLEVISNIPAHKSIVTDRSKYGRLLRGNDIIRVALLVPGSHLPRELTRSTTLDDDSRTVKIGDVVFEEATNTMVQRSHADLSGIRFHNQLSIPLEIHLEGKVPAHLANIGPDDGTDYHAGSLNSVYVNNDANGFHLGDEILITVKGGCPQLYSIRISDNYMSDVYIGKVTQKNNIPIQDQYSYKIDKPNEMGLKYYTPVTAYTSM